MPGSPQSGPQSGPYNYLLHKHKQHTIQLPTYKDMYIHPNKPPKNSYEYYYNHVSVQHAASSMYTPLPTYIFLDFYPLFYTPKLLLANLNSLLIGNNKLETMLTQSLLQPSVSLTNFPQPHFYNKPVSLSLTTKANTNTNTTKTQTNWWIDMHCLRPLTINTITIYSNFHVYDYIVAYLYTHNTNPEFLRKLVNEIDNPILTNRHKITLYAHASPSTYSSLLYKFDKCDRSLCALKYLVLTYYQEQLVYSSFVLWYTTLTSMHKLNFLYEILYNPQLTANPRPLTTKIIKYILSNIYNVISSSNSNSTSNYTLSIPTFIHFAFKDFASAVNPSSLNTQTLHHIQY